MKIKISLNEGEICAKGKAWAMRKYGKWSAYAAMGASKYCKDPNYGKGKKKNEEVRDTYDDEVVRRNKKSREKGASSLLKKEGELKKWRDEQWVQADGTPCGDPKAQKNPKRCKPKAKWATMSKGEKKADQAKKKTGGKKGKQFVGATKKGKVTKKYTKEGIEMNKKGTMKVLMENFERFLNEEKETLSDSELEEIVLDVLKKEGGAAGLGPIKDALEGKVADVEALLRDMKAKGGGDRIRPGTKKGDAYCARSLKIKKCKNPPCANTLSRKKWKCRGAKSVAEQEVPDIRGYK